MLNSDTNVQYSKFKSCGHTMVGEEDGARTLTTDTNCLHVCKIGMHFQAHLWESINTIVPFMLRKRTKTKERKEVSQL